MSIRAAILIVLTLVGARSAGFAQSEVRSRFMALEHQIALPFQPEEIVMLIERGEGERVTTSRVRGGAIPLESEESSRLRGGLTRYLVGTVIERPGPTERIRYSILLAGKANRYEFVPMREATAGAQDPFFDRAPEEGDGRIPMYSLRAAVLERRAKLESLRKEVDGVSADLERVGRSAQAIEGFDEILQIRAERRKIESEVEGAAHYTESLARSIERSRVSPAPSNFTRRELELTQQIAAIVKATTESPGDEPAGANELDLSLPALRHRFGVQEVTSTRPTRGGLPGKRGARLTGRPRASPEAR